MKCCRRNTSEVIPTDLIIDILSRLPSKSIARCRCVSKPWASMLGRPDVTKYFLAKSCGRPQILFTCHKKGKLFFFSTPQVQNMDENSSLITVSYHMKKFVSDASIEICGGSVGGLVYLTHPEVLKGRKEYIVPVICNPSTGQSLTLPTIKTDKIILLGYDPIGNEYKVLSMTSLGYGSYKPEEHQILTLGARKPSRRTVDCCTPHYSTTKNVCINGVLYYLAFNLYSVIALIVSFNVRSEKFRFISIGEGMTLSGSTLVNYKGKLASLSSNGFKYLRAPGETKSFEMWVLEDEEKHVWSKHVLELPPMWHKNIAEDVTVFIVGLTGTNEIVLSPGCLSDPFYIFYYNIDTKTIRRVEIQGMGAFKGYRVCTYVNHVEDVKLMELEIS